MWIVRRVGAESNTCLRQEGSRDKKTRTIDLAVCLPRSSYVASSTDVNDHTIHIWDGLTGNTVLIYRDSGVSAFAASPDGRWIASCSYGLRVWDATTGNTLAHIEGHRINAHALAWSPDGKYIATDGLFGKIHIWDAATGQRLFKQEEREGSGWIKALAWSPDGKYIASGNSEGIVQVWKVESAPTKKNEEKREEFTQTERKQHPIDTSLPRYQDRTLTCRECGKDFVFTAGEQEFFVSHSLTISNQPNQPISPTRCPRCREARRRNEGAREKPRKNTISRKNPRFQFSQRNSPHMHHDSLFICDWCGTEYVPSVDEQESSAKHDDKNSPSYCPSCRIARQKRRTEKEQSYAKIEEAEHLFSNGNEQAAGSIAGVVLESQLKKLCDMNSFTYPRKPMMQHLVRLLQDAKAITPAEAGDLIDLASIRNQCAHESSVPTRRCKVFNRKS